MADPILKPFAELTTTELYRLLQLRTDVFVVEQECPYAEVDGRDLEPGTVHAWIPGDDGAPLACLRVLTEPDGIRIGRVATRSDARGRGLAGQLMRAILAANPGTRIDLEAQSYLLDWYRGFGFEPVGEEFLDVGIPHTAMVREPSD